MFEEGKTAYSLFDEHGDKSTITVIKKRAADLLQEMLPDVHEWVQEKYNLVCEKKPHLSRRKKGDVVRMLAYREAERSSRYAEFVSDL